MTTPMKKLAHIKTCGINIMTDARHGRGKNSKDTSLVTIEEIIHKVLNCGHGTKDDDKVSRRY